MKIRPISLGQQCTVGALSAVLPDANMEDFATLAEMSLVSLVKLLHMHVSSCIAYCTLVTGKLATVWTCVATG